MNKLPFSPANVPLGESLPSRDKHAVSVSMPKWRNIIEYEDKNPETISKLSTGYPRFLIHSLVQLLQDECIMKYGIAGEYCKLFTSSRYAKECQEYIIRKAKVDAQDVRMISIGERLNLFAVFYHSRHAAFAKEFWQHTGTGISSRNAEDYMNQYVLDSSEDQFIKSTIKARILNLQSIQNLSISDVYLFESGMSAIYNAYIATQKLIPNRETVQFGFAYVDNLRIQEKFGNGCKFFGFGSESDILDLKQQLESGLKLSALFCEFPSNPLLKSANLIELYKLSKEFKFIFIVDETIGNFVNVNVLEYCDLIVSSLTKIFSGNSNVMAGSIVLNPNSSFYLELSNVLNSIHQDTLWCNDAKVLEINSRDFCKRVQLINNNADKLCDFLYNHKSVENIFYPKFIDNDMYRKIAKNPDMPGYGGLFSLILYSEEDAISFFDALQIAKGPSLGTNFTLACPYTLLAHFHELKWASEFGASKRLIRVSVGMENPETLIQIFDDALKFCSGNSDQMSRKVMNE